MHFYIIIAGGTMRVKGFSLIEFLVVLSILAIINFVLFPNISSIQNSAKSISAKSIARNIMVSLEQYYFIYSTYPEGNDVSIVTVLNELQSLDIIDSIPINPFTGNTFSVDDVSGEIIYTFLDSGGYQLLGYGHLNDDLIFEY